MTSFDVGSIVNARGRDWVVLPDSDPDLLLLRPLGGTDEEVAGLWLPLEGDEVHSSQVHPPGVEDLGDHLSCRRLRDAVQLSFRDSAGPFRSFARIACEPRPYQLVPLLMALRQDVVRLLIADDVGIGKTIEACLVARELLDRGEVRRTAVLCPPHLAEQWQRELREKFHLEAELVLPSTVRRLERGLAPNQSLFERYPHVVVSLDYIKADRRRDDFVRACPELVIVDEAHTCAWGEDRQGRHQRHHLLEQLAADPRRHLLLVTATPHSGKDDAFRSLLALLDPSLADLPQDLGGSANEKHRRRLATFFIQRRRRDITRYLDAETPFPEREEGEATYVLSPPYRAFFDRALDFARHDEGPVDAGDVQKRVHWWSVLALLRSIASSPAAAEATLRNRAASAGAETADEADELGRRTVFDLDDEVAETSDVAPGAKMEDEEEGEDGPGEPAADRRRRRLQALAREAEKLRPDDDAKLLLAVERVRELLEAGFRPIVFCRFIPTAAYLAEQLRKGLPQGVEVAPVTGELPPAEREKRVLDLAHHDQRVLVATDCLSEGINLQDHFDAVVHYDLSWSPTRHEQREGRVDRYGQKRELVRSLTLYGTDNRIDGLVLDNLLRKHRTIRKRLGVAVPVPDTTQALEAILEGLLLREEEGQQVVLPFVEDARRALDQEWARSEEREKRSQSMFAQHALKPELVAAELEAARRAIGGSDQVERFLRGTFVELGATVSGDRHATFDLRETPRSTRDAIGRSDRFEACFELPRRDEDEEYLHRTHPVVAGLARWVLEAALERREDGVVRRAGVVRTGHVEVRTVLLLLRLRFQIRHAATPDAPALLAEDCALRAFRGSADAPEWLSDDEVEALLEADPGANVPRDFAVRQFERLATDLDPLQPHLEDFARRRADELLEAHTRVRKAVGGRGGTPSVEPELPADLLGLWLYLPA